MGDTRNDPSMDDILASIKRIIADDTPPTRPLPAAAELSEPESGEIDEPDAQPARNAEVLELTQPAPGLAARGGIGGGRDSLATLSRMTIRPEIGNDNSLEGLVRELLRPMLKEWLDANLPELVESLVTREVARLTGKAL